jgi:uncharacterized membrane protein
MKFLGKEAIMSSRKRAQNLTWREAWPIWLTFTVLLVVGIVGIWLFFPASEISAKALHDGQDAVITVNELQPNVPVLFAYPLKSGSTTEFFVEHGENDTITVAFASCRKCFRSGHYLQEAQIFCGQCTGPMVRATEGHVLGREKDCIQIPIPFGRSGNRLTIRAGAIGDTFSRWYGTQL